MPVLNKEQLGELNERVENMVRTARQRTRDWQPMYERGLDYIYNNQTRYVDVKDSFQRIQANMLFPSAMQEIALLIQRRPTIVVRPMTDEQEDVAAADVWGGYLEYCFKYGLRMAEWLVKARLDGKAAGFWVGKVYWEPRAEWNREEKRWQGAPRITLVKPDYFGVDPDAETLETAEYIYVERRVRVDYAVKRWTKHKEAIEAAAHREYEQDTAAAAGSIITGVGSQVALDATAEPGEKDPGVKLVKSEFLSEFIRGTTAKDEIAGGGGRPAREEPRYVTLLEIYFKDEEEGEGEEWPKSIDALRADGAIELRSTPNGVGQAWYFSGTEQLLSAENWPKSKEPPMPVFPHGRMVLRVGTQILNDDTDDQRWPYRAWPYVVGLHYPLPHVWQGLNGVEMAAGLQDFRNLGFTHVLNHLQHFSDPAWKVEEGALMVPDDDEAAVENELAPRPGKIVRTHAGKIAGVEAVKTPPLGEGALRAIGLGAEEIRSVTGVYEVFQGASTPGAATATEVLRLETNSKLRVGLQAFYEELFIKDTMARVLELCQANLTAGDVIRVVGEHKRMIYQRLGESDVRAQLDIDLEISSELPYDKERGKLEAERLYGVVGLPYLPRLLQAFDVRNPEELLEQIPDWVAYQRFREAQKRMEELEARGQASPTGQGETRKRPERSANVAGSKAG